MPDPARTGFDSRFATSRRDAVLMAVAIITVGGLFDAGYYCGARAEHPNSIWTMVGITLIGAVCGLLWGLWQAAPSARSRHPKETP
jgi:hypothetical protein